MLKKRTLSILLSLAMLLTFMPAMAFAEEIADDASEQSVVTEEAENVTAAEESAEEPNEATAPVAEQPEDPSTEKAGEEMSELEQSAAEDEAVEEVSFQSREKVAYPVPMKIVMTPKSPLYGYAGEDEILNFYGDFEVTYDNGDVKVFKDKSDDVFYVNENGVRRTHCFDYGIKGGRLKKGKNTVSLEMVFGNSDDYYKVDLGTVEVEGIESESVISVEYQQVKPFEVQRYENEKYNQFFGRPMLDESFAGDKVIVKTYLLIWGMDEYNTWIDHKEGPYTLVYECKYREDYGYDFYLVNDEYKMYFDEILKIKFWDDQRDPDSPQWKPGGTYSITATVEGVEASGDILVNVVPVPNEEEHVHKLKKIKKVAATCQHTGVKEHYECTSCGELFKDKKGKKETTVEALSIKKTAHKYKNKKVASEEFLKTPATCTKKGVYYYCAECKMCHEQTKAKKTYKGGALKPHEFTKIDKVEATCQHAGMKAHYKCSLCNKLYASEKAKKATTAKKLKIKKLKHKYTAKVEESKYKAKKTGMYYYSCPMCGAKGKKTFKAAVPVE